MADQIQILKTISRIKSSPDGMEFMTYLAELSQRNYLSFKAGDANANELHKGYALAIDSLIDVFETCDLTLLLKQKPPETGTIF